MKSLLLLFLVFYLVDAEHRVLNLAASDSLIQDKDNADYVCPGSKDQNCIMKAICDLKEAPLGDKCGENDDFKIGNDNGNGGTINFAPGTYHVDDTVYIYSNIHMIGDVDILKNFYDGVTVPTIRLMDNVPYRPEDKAGIFRVFESKNTVIDGFYFNGNRDNQPGGVDDTILAERNAVMLYVAMGSEVKNIIAENWEWNGIHIYNSLNVRSKNIHSRRNHMGFFLGGSSDPDSSYEQNRNVLLTSTEPHRSILEHNDHFGFRVREGKGVIIEKCDILNNKKHGISISGEDVYIMKNLIKDNIRDGISIEANNHGVICANEIIGNEGCVQFIADENLNLHVDSTGMVFVENKCDNSRAFNVEASEEYKVLNSVIFGNEVKYEGEDNRITGYEIDEELGYGENADLGYYGNMYENKENGEMFVDDLVKFVPIKVDNLNAVPDEPIVRNDTDTNFPEDDFTPTCDDKVECFYNNNDWDGTCKNLRKDICYDKQCGVYGESGCGTKWNFPDQNSPSQPFADERCCTSPVRNSRRICGVGVNYPCVIVSNNRKLLRY